MAHWGNSLFSKPTSKSCFPHQLFSISLQHIPCHQMRLLHLFFFYAPKRNFWHIFSNLIFSWKTIFSQWSLTRFHSQPPQNRCMKQGKGNHIIYFPKDGKIQSNQSSYKLVRAELSWSQQTLLSYVLSQKSWTLSLKTNTLKWRISQWALPVEKISCSSEGQN